MLCGHHYSAGIRLPLTRRQHCRIHVCMPLCIKSVHEVWAENAHARLLHSTIGQASGHLAVVVWMVLVSAMTLGQTAWADAIGQIKTLSGDVSIVRNNVKSPAKAGDLLEKADTLMTGTDGRVGITFIDNSRFSLGPNSQVAPHQTVVR